MITVVSRKDMFEKCILADQIIAKFQRSYASDFDPNVHSEKKVLKKYYDHLKETGTDKEISTTQSVIAFPATSLTEYRELFAEKLSVILQNLGISQVYLTDFLKADLLEFPFGSFAERNSFKRRFGSCKTIEAVLSDTKDLTSVFTPFLFLKKFDIPLVFIFSANEKIPLSIHLCDDGNLHLEYDPQFEEPIKREVSQQGFIKGDREICDAYSICRLK